MGLAGDTHRGHRDQRRHRGDRRLVVDHHHPPDMARTAARGRRCDPCRRPASSSYPTATGSLEDGMIRFADVTFTHAQSGRPVVSNVDLTIPEGDLALVIGRTGSGKSTLLNMVNGLVPHFTGGTLRGEVRVNGMDVRKVMVLR